MIHVNRGATSLGAFSEEQVREGLRTGRFAPTDIGWREGMATWQPLSQFPELGVTAPTAPPAQVGAAATLEPAPICVGGAAGAAAPNSGNWESGCQVAIPSRHPISVAAKRPVRRPSRTSSSENAPKLVAPRLTWIMAMIGRFREMRREAQVKWLKEL